MKGLLFVCSLFVAACLADEVVVDHHPVVDVVIPQAVPVVPVQKTGVPGKCPEIKQVKDFNPSKMAGKWHSIYETGKVESCVCYEFEEATPGHFHGYLYHLNQTVSLDLKNVDDPTEGHIIKAKFVPYQDKAVIKAFSVDYDSYAAIFSCKEVGDVHYPFYAFWSRSYQLSDEKVEELKGILSQYDGFEVPTFHRVNHDDCYV